jgi:hypothetical protein
VRIAMESLRLFFYLPGFRCITTLVLYVATNLDISRYPTPHSLGHASHVRPRVKQLERLHSRLVRDYCIMAFSVESPGMDEGPPEPAGMCCASRGISRGCGPPKTVRPRVSSVRELALKHPNRQERHGKGQEIQINDPPLSPP